MRWISEVRERVGGVLFRGRREAELDEELRFHLEMQTEANLRAGMSPAEARRRARLAFGPETRHREAVRDARGLGIVEELARDLRHALRALRGAPTFTAVAVLTLALGIGATTAVYGVVDAVLLRPLAYREPDRIVRLLEYRTGAEERWGTISSPNFYDWRERVSAFESAALYDEYRPTLRTAEGPVRVDGASVSASYFDVLGVRPALGRFFLPEEEEPGSAAVVLSWGLWQERFGGDRGVLGATLDLGGFPYRVVGVAPRGMEDPGLSGASTGAPRLWRSTPSYFATNGRSGRSFTAIARLRPGVTPERAQEELSAVHADLAARFPEENAGYGVRVEPLKEGIVGEVRPALRVLMAAVGLVLLIACANVANLLLFRASERAREISLRAALGAGRRRLVRGLLVESLVLSAGGAALGVGLAALATRALGRLAAGQVPRLGAVGMDPRVLGFAVAAAVATALLFGLLPAVHATRVDLARTLQAGGRSGTGSREQGRVRDLLVAAEVALAVVVVVSGALLARSLVALQGVDPGLEVGRLVTLEIDPPYDPYFADDADTLGLAVSGLYDRVLERVRALPGVEAAGLTDILPLSGSFNGNVYRLPGRPEGAPDEELRAEVRAASPGFFAAMGIPRVRGAGFHEPISAVEPPAVLVNEALARRHWPGADPVGREIETMGGAWTIAGVVGDVSEFSLERAPEPTIYLAHARAPAWMRDEQTLVVRTSLDAAAALAGVRDAVRAVEPRMPVSEGRTMESVLAETLARPRFRTLLLSAFAALALLLSAVGVYGLIANRVASRTREMGVRMALGASARQVVALVLRRGLRVVGAGIAVGLIGAALAGRVLAGLLFGVGPADPLTFAAVPLALLAVAGGAAWIPARRAARVPVMEVLREE